jgi:hypothetical protein
MHAVEKELQECRRELFRLLNENAALRYAAMSFGDLAERLNFIVNRHRRHGVFPSATQLKPDYSPSDDPGGAQSFETGHPPRHRPSVPGIDTEE